MTPLDVALRLERVTLVHKLLARDAKCRVCKPIELTRFLHYHPAMTEEDAEVRIEEEMRLLEEHRKREAVKQLPLPVVLSPLMLQRVAQGTLHNLSDGDIRQELMEGKLSCGWSDRSSWRAIVLRVKEYENARAQQMNPADIWRQQQQDVDARRQDVQQKLDRLQLELFLLTQQHTQLEQCIQKHEETTKGPLNLSGLLDFARRAQAVEERLVAELEEEMEKEKPELAALSDFYSTQPKLSVLLNCMGIGEAAIEATRDLDGERFKQLSKRTEDFVDRFSSARVGADVIQDMLYCGEMMREAEFPYTDHDIECVVCANRTAAQMVNFIKERPDMFLPFDALDLKDINGRRALFCTFNDFKDFPGVDKQRVLHALDCLRGLHEEALAGSSGEGRFSL